MEIIRFIQVNVPYPIECQMCNRPFS